MNILVVCNYDLYQNLTYSFVHSQIREYVKLGHRVRVLVPAAMGMSSRNYSNLEQRICMWEQPAYRSMTSLMVGYRFLLFWSNDL